MTTEFTVQPDPEQLAEMQRRLEIWGGNTADVMRVAINNTARRARSSTALPGGGASQRIRERYNIKDAAQRLGVSQTQYINERLKVFTANRNNLLGKVYGRKRGMLLSPFRQGLTGLQMGTRATEPQVNVLKLTGTRPARKVPDTVSKPFYILTRNTGQILIVGRKADDTLKVARTISVSQAFNFLRRDMMPAVQEDFVKQQVRAARHLLQKLNVPMEDPEEP
jgi:hypothetical protein